VYPVLLLKETFQQGRRLRLDLARSIAAQATSDGLRVEKTTFKSENSQR